MNLGGLSGLRAWAIQRLSATYIAIFILFFIIPWSWRPAMGFVQWHAWVADPMNNSAIALFVVALLMHGWIGARDIVLDYVKPYTLRAAVLSVLIVALFLLALWALRILFLVGYS